MSNVEPSVEPMLEDDFFYVEKILGKKVSDEGIVRYKIKWYSFPMSQASWEPLSNLTNCSDAIASFEETLKTQGAKKKNTPKKRGFARGLTAERIIGAVRVASGIMFLMKWEERSEDDVDLVTARQANIKCPQVVIKYYESVVEIQLKPV